LDVIATGAVTEWGPAFVSWELGLLNELGFGLDLAACAVTGRTDDLTYVSPRTGRAVSREAGIPYRDRLLFLPPFLRREYAQAITIQDVSAGLRLTAHFLNRWVFEPDGKELPFARQRLAELMSADHG
jgi:DNA repair protein RecO (recombination protein O)